MNGRETVTKTFATGQKAATVLKGLLPSDWLFREQVPDFHIDYVVEVVETGELTGTNFGVQLKGTQPKTGEPLLLKYPLKVKHLRYFLRKATLPVFLVLLDTVTGKAYWCFTQRFASELVDKKRLERGGTISVPFLEDDCFDDLDRFKQALCASVAYVRDLHPGSIPAAVKAERARLRAIDPRIDASISLIEGRQNVTLKANQAFEFKAKVTGRDTPEFRQSLLAFIERGDELKLDSSDLQFEGAPVLSHAFSGTKEGYVKLKFGREVRGTMQVFEAGDSPAFLFQIDGRFKCGTKFVTFEGSLPNSALSFKTTVSADGILNGEPHNLGLSFNPDDWVGQPVAHLAFFDQIHRFFRNLGGVKPPRLRFLTDGNDLFGGEFSGLDSQAVGSIREILDLINKARFVVRRYKLNPCLPPLESIPGTELKAIEDIYDLFHSGEARMPKPNFQFAFKVRGSGLPAGDNLPGVLRVDSPSHDFDILGSKIQLGSVSHFFTSATIANATPMEDGGMDIVITGSAESEWIMKLQDSASSEKAKVTPPNSTKQDSQCLTESHHSHA